MKYKLIALVLHRLNIVNLILFARTVVSKMGVSAYFADPANLPDPTLLDIKQAATDLEEAEENKKVLGIANRDNKRDALRNLLKQEALYVQSVAKGDAVIIEAAGMTAKKGAAPQPVPDQVIGLKLTDGHNAGEVDVNFRAVKGTRKTYHIRINTTPDMADSGWAEAGVTSKLHFLLTGLTSAKKVAVSVCAQNANGFGDWSTVAVRTVQ